MWKSIKLFFQATLIISVAYALVFSFGDFIFQLNERQRAKHHDRELETLALVQAHELRLEEVRWTRRSAELGANQWVWSMVAERLVESLKALLDGNSPLERLGR